MKPPSLTIPRVIGFFVIPVSIALGLLALRLLAPNDSGQNRQLIPDLLTIWETGQALLGSTPFWSAVAHTSKVVLIATGCAVVAGFTLGICLTYAERVWSLSVPTIDFIRSIPVTFFVAPLAVLWGSKSPYLVITLAAVPSTIFLILGIRQGVLHHDPDRVRAFDLYLGRKDLLSRFRWILVPESMPHILHGLRLGISYALVIVTVLEYFDIGEDAGLGSLLKKNQENYQNAAVFALMISVGILGFLLNKGIERFGRWHAPVPGRTSSN